MTTNAQNEDKSSEFEPMEQSDWTKLAELRDVLELTTDMPFTVLQIAIARINRLTHELSQAATKASAAVWLTPEGKAYGRVSDEQIEAVLLNALANVRLRSGLDKYQASVVVSEPGTVLNEYWAIHRRSKDGQEQGWVKQSGNYVSLFWPREKAEHLCINEEYEPRRVLLVTAPDDYTETLDLVQGVSSKQVDEDAERKAFEHWGVSSKTWKPTAFARDNNGDYVDDEIHGQWQVWLARAQKSFNP